MTSARKTKSGDRPIETQLREAASRAYGVSCDQIFCRARGDDRLIYLPDDLHARRDEAIGGTWITARLWIPDDKCPMI